MKSGGKKWPFELNYWNGVIKRIVEWSQVGEKWPFELNYPNVITKKNRGVKSSRKKVTFRIELLECHNKKDRGVKPSGKKWPFDLNYWNVIIKQIVEWNQVEKKWPFELNYPNVRSNRFLKFIGCVKRHPNKKTAWIKLKIIISKWNFRCKTLLWNVVRCSILKQSSKQNFHHFRIFYYRLSGHL